MPNVLKPSQYKQQQTLVALESCEIQSNSLLTEAEEAAKKIIDSAKLMAEQIINDARQEVAKIQADAKEKFDQAYDNGLASGEKEGYEAGYSKGIDEGNKFAYEKVDSLINDLIAVINNFQSAEDAVRKKQEEELPEIITEIAGNVLSQIVTQHNELMCDLIEDCLKDFYNESYFNIYVSKDIYELINHDGSDFINRIKSISGDIRFMKKNDLDNTDCIIEASEYVLDVSLNSQLDKIKSVLRK